MAQRSKDLRKLAGTLKDLAAVWNVAVVAVNQVTDTFNRVLSQGTQSDEELLALDYQAKWFDGLIEEGRRIEVTKRPALGLAWTNLITTRVMLVRDNDGRTRIKVVFSPFARSGSLVYEIGKAGIHAVELSLVKRLLEDEVTKKLDIEEPERPNLGSDLEARLDDIEFSDLDVEDLLPGQTNI